MSIRTMHYNFKRKLNKLDSQQNRNLEVPEIDMVLNEALQIYIKLIAQPRVKNHLGFEINQRTIDDIRPLVEPNKVIQVVNKKVSLPSNYQYFIRGRVKCSKGDCTNSNAVLYIREHDDEFDKSAFTKSSYEWETVNGLFTSEGIELYYDGFEVESVSLSYLRRHPYIHNAQDYVNGTYNTLSGETLTGFKDCELPLDTHNEIVDIAVLIASGELQYPDYNVKTNKISLNQIN